MPSPETSTPGYGPLRFGRIHFGRIRFGSVRFGRIRFGPLSPGGYTLRLGDKENRYFHAIPAEVDLPWSGPPLVLEQGAPVEGR